MLGAPSSGKGKYCESICAEYRVPHISTSDLLRQAVNSGSDLGKAAKAYMERGEIVADEVMLPIVIQHLSSDKLKASGWLLDGFPRTRAQAEELRGAKLQPQVMLWIDVAKDILIDRVEQRRFDPVTGQLYYINQAPPTDSEVGAAFLPRVGIRLFMFSDVSPFALRSSVVWCIARTICDPRWNNASTLFKPQYKN